MNAPGLTAAAAAAVSDAIRVRPRVPFLEWAPAHIRGEDGPFRFRPCQVVPASAIFNPSIHSVSLRWYSGAGKTYLFAAAMGYAIRVMKLQIGTMFPAAKGAEDWLRQKIEPFLANTPEVAEIGKSRSVADEIVWHNGASIKVVGANSAGVTRTLEIHWANAEEIDAILQDAKAEGDRLKIFEKRTRGRAIQIHTRSAYPSIKGRSQIDAAIEDSNNCNWYFDCPKCGKPQLFEPDHIKHPAEKPELSVVECPGCSGTFGDADRLASAEETGKWIDRHGAEFGAESVPSEEDGRNLGLTLNCMAHVGAHNRSRRNYLHEVASLREAIASAPNPALAEQEFENTMAARSWERKFEAAANTSFLIRQREDYRPLEELPPGVLAMTWGADMNKRFVSVLIKGWGLNGESWGIDYADIHGKWDDPKTLEGLGRFVFREFKHPCGAPMRPLRGFLDTRFKPNTTRRWVRANANRGAMACTGSTELGVGIIHTDRADKHTRIRIQSIGTHEAKDQIAQHLQIVAPADPGAEFPENYPHYPREGPFTADYFAALTEAEHSYIKQARNGKMFPFFEKTEACENGRIRNEPLDVEVYALAAKLVYPISFPRIAAKFAAMKEDEKKTAPRRRPKRPNKFIQGFR